MDYIQKDLVGLSFWLQQGHQLSIVITVFMSAMVMMMDLSLVKELAEKLLLLAISILTFGRRLL
ncbi:hypothetical protein BIY30_00005 [Gibbsiella quercinecans]|nr:hypothetical protein BIY30_00005 [Gibbsiella quercinecans]